MEKEANRIFRCCRKYTIVLSLIGIALSYYSILVSENKTKDASYSALCDISETVKCSDVLVSPWSKGFGIVLRIFGEASPLYVSNGHYGLIFYIVTVILSLFPHESFSKLLLLLATISVLMSFYLGCILFYVLKEICVVCITTYMINLGIFAVSFRNKRAIKQISDSARAPDYSSYLDGKVGKKRV